MPGVVQQWISVGMDRGVMGWGAVLAALDDYRGLTRVLNGAWPPLIVLLQLAKFAGEISFNVIVPFSPACRQCGSHASACRYAI